MQISNTYHLYHKVLSHLMRVRPIAGYLELTRCSDILIEEQYRLKDAYIIHDEIGAGIDFNKETVKQYEYRY